MALIITLKHGETLSLGEDIKIKTKQSPSNRATTVRVIIDAPENMIITHGNYDIERIKKICSRMTEDEKVLFFNHLEKELDY